MADTWDEEYSFLDDKYAMEAIEDIETDNRRYLAYWKTCQKHREDKIAHWEPILSYSQRLNSRLTIIVKRNMAINIGIDENSTHTAADIRQIPKSIRKLFTVPLYEQEGPIVHPKYIIEDRNFLKQYLEIIYGKNEFDVFARKVESLFLKFRYGGFSAIGKTIKKRINYTRR